jgi:hypothetical protein
MARDIHRPTHIFELAQARAEHLRAINEAAKAGRPYSVRNHMGTWLTFNYDKLPRSAQAQPARQAQPALKLAA